jgi:hypothetical protein
MGTTSLGIVSAAVLMVSCGGASTGTGETYKIATASARSDFMNLARADGVIQGQTNSDGTACFWLGTNSAGEALSWPYGYSARANPLAVYDDSGNRVAVVGHRVTMAGGLMPDSVHSITGCSGFTRFLGVGQVVSDN